MKMKIFITMLSLLLISGISIAADDSLKNYSSIKNVDEFSLDETSDKRIFYASCTAGLSLYRGFVIRTFRARASSWNYFWAKRRACRIALNSCHRYDRFVYRGLARCAIMRRGYLDENSVE